MVWFQEGDVEYGMDAHGVGEVKAESGLSNGFQDSEGTEAFRIEFVTGSSSSDVATEKPDSIAR